MDREAMIASSLAPGGGPRLEFLVRNTFIDAIEPGPVVPKRRCVSEPPPLSRDRHDTEADSDVDVAGSDGEKETTASSDAEKDTATSEAEKDAARDSSDASTASVAGSVAEEAPPPPSLRGGGATPVQKRSPLSSKAKAWAPPAAPQRKGRVSQAAKFDTEARAFLDSVTAKLWSAGLIIASDTTWSSEVKGAKQMCAVRLDMAAQDPHHLEMFLAMLRSNLQEAASACAHITVMGSGKEPFVPLPQGEQGFSVMLGNRVRPEAACWNAYSEGFCRRGSSCCWQHPTKLLQVDFHVACLPPLPFEQGFSSQTIGAYDQLGVLGLDGVPPEYCVCVVPAPWSGDCPAGEPGAELSV